ncbi:MAG TPA: hypothetical protein VGO96_01540, partial [Pyrinomonadaceae bacterium]|nr:hypothetical protein [Pyrinomonadaceae bacterium]
MRRNFNFRLRALAASLCVALACVVYLSLPRGAARVAIAQGAQGAQANTNANTTTATAQTSTPSSVVGGALTAQEKRGKEVYLRGTSASGQEIMAYLGEASLEVPASTMTCAGCHGFDGQGKPEG